MFSTTVWERGWVILAGRPRGGLLVEVICLRSGEAGRRQNQRECMMMGGSEAVD